MYWSCVHNIWKNYPQTEGLTMSTILLGLLGVVQLSHGQLHNNTLKIFEDKLAADMYHTQVRPVLDQSQPVYVKVTFDIISIIELNDADEQFHCSGFLKMKWNDELVAWDPSDYGGVGAIHPLPKDVWRPRVILVNTLKSQDIFEDANAPMIISHTGTTTWLPSSLFSTSCGLDLTKYPYDEQTCIISIFSMGWTRNEVMFQVSSSEVGKEYFTPHDEWKLAETLIEVFDVKRGSELVSTIDITLKLQRRPSFIVINIIVPVVLLSLLNMLVFAIPVETLEKLSYGVTVLLALTVYIGITSGILPRTSNNFPLISMYMLAVFILSVLAVIVSIVIVHSSNTDQKNEGRESTKGDVERDSRRASDFQKAVEPLDTEETSRKSSLRISRGLSESASDHQTEGVSDAVDLHYEEEEPRIEASKPEESYIDAVSLTVFLLIWLGLTLGFMIAIMM